MAPRSDPLGDASAPSDHPLPPPHGDVVDGWTGPLARTAALRPPCESRLVTACLATAPAPGLAFEDEGRDLLETNTIPGQGSAI